MTKRTKQEIVKYFKFLAKKYEDEMCNNDVNIQDALKAYGSWDAYRHAAYCVECTMEDDDEH